MWFEVSEKIKQAGYVPDTSHVPAFTDQQEREAKLALAFALISTPPGTRIVIIKNIRLCGDCHSAIK